jgi:hypothetical protein
MATRIKYISVPFRAIPWHLSLFSVPFRGFFRGILLCFPVPTRGFHLTSFKKRKYSSRDIPAVLRLLRIIATGTSEYVGIITGRFTPSLAYAL